MKDFIIETNKDILSLQEALKQLIDKASIDDLSYIYSRLTSKVVIDHREDSIYTNVEAQDDPDFWAEQDTMLPIDTFS